MRLGLTTRNPFEALLLATGWYPSPLLLGFWGMASSRTLMAGVELGVFEVLAEKPSSAAEVASAIGCDAVGTEALLNALNGFGYVRRRGGIYRNSRVVRRWLTRQARFPLADAFGLFRILWREMDDIEGRLRSTTPREFHADRDERFWRDYESGLAQFAQLASGEIVRKTKLPRAPKRLLDVGGGHGAYAMRFCAKYPELHADILDLPGAAAVGRARAAEAGLADRITYREADLASADWGSGYDIVLLFNVVHIFTPEQCAELFSKAFAALAPGGTFIVLDSAHKGRAGDIDTAGGANELLFYVLNNTRAYPEQDVARWMRDAGFADVRTRHLTLVPQAAISFGVRNTGSTG